MADALTLVFGLVFPVAAFAGGVYLVLRGMRRGSSAPDAAGPVSSSSPLLGPLGHAACAYYKIVVERYRPGHSPWEQVYATERSARFSVGRSEVSPDNADVRASAASVHTGYLKPGKGIISDLRANARHVRALADFTGEVAPGEFLEDDVILSVLGLPGAAEKLKPHLGSALRVTEYALPIGAEACVFQDPDLPKEKGAPLQGSLEYPLIVCDKASLSQAPLLREKSMLSLALGAVLIAVSFIRLAFMLYS
jgi:hypothetical protein